MQTLAGLRHLRAGLGWGWAGAGRLQFLHHVGPWSHKEEATGSLMTLPRHTAFSLISRYSPGSALFAVGWGARSTPSTNIRR